MSEFARSDDVRAGRYTANTFEHRLLEYAAVDGDAIFEGDIVLGTVAHIEAVSRQPQFRRLQPEGIAIKGDHFRWPGGEIPYRFQPEFPRRERVLDAIRHWEDKTPIRFILLDSSNLGQYPDNVLFSRGTNCSSQVGRRGRQQVISLGDGCDLGNAMHEIGHTVGLWHEQSRRDRDLYVIVDESNIRPKDLHNFKQHVNDGQDIDDYDYHSMMHYPSNAFSSNGRPTIVARNGAAIGQRRGLSERDIATVKAMYP